MAWHNDIENLVHKHVKPYDKAAPLAHAITAIAWDVVNRQTGQLDRLDEVVDEVTARAEAAEAYIERIRTALDGYPDSDLASLAETLNVRNVAAEAEVARLNNELASTLADLIGCDGDEGRDTTEAVARWEAIMGDKWQGG